MHAANGGGGSFGNMGRPGSSGVFSGGGMLPRISEAGRGTAGRRGGAASSSGAGGLGDDEVRVCVAGW